MLSIKERVIQENINRVFGNRPEAELVFKVQTGKLTQEEIDEYETKRDEETQYFKHLFEFDKPRLPSVYEPEPNQSVILSDLILKDKSPAENDDNSIRGSEDQGNEDTLPLNQE